MKLKKIKQARLKFEDEPDLRQENEGRLKTLQELEMLRSNQKQADNSVTKIKRDLEEINRSIVMKENSAVHIVDFQTPTEQWKQEREKIRETFDAKSLEEGKEKGFSESGVFMKTSNEEKKNLENKTESKIEEAKNMHFESKAKEKLEEIRQIDLEAKAKAKMNEIKNLEIFKLKEKTVE